MPRVDIWDVAKAREAPPIDAGFPRSFEKRCVCACRHSREVPTRHAHHTLPDTPPHTGTREHTPSHRFELGKQLGKGGFGTVR